MADQRTRRNNIAHAIVAAEALEVDILRVLAAVDGPLTYRGLREKLGAFYGSAPARILIAELVLSLTNRRYVTAAGSGPRGAAQFVITGDGQRVAEALANRETDR
jgi:hypothetical protein